jgi:hypothetical protein
MSKVIAVTQDQIVLVDGVAVSASKYGGYQMTNGEWSVNFDSELGIGEIEYLDARPNKQMNQADIERYMWLIDLHADIVEKMAMEGGANE